MIHHNNVALFYAFINKVPILLILLVECFSGILLQPLFAETLVFPPFGHSYGIRKATPNHLFVFFGPRTAFDNPQGLATARLEVWDNPETENDDDEVVVYGVNSDRHQIIYNTSMWTLGIYGKKGSDENCFHYPKGIAADNHGNVYVADSGNNRIVKLKNPKSSLLWVKKFGESFMKGPSRVALDEDGNVYVTDTGNHRLLIMSSEGEVLGEVVGEFVPTALAVADGKSFRSFYKKERVLFYSDGGSILIKADLEGKTILKKELPSGYSASYGAVDYYHNYWVTDSKKHVLLKYDHHLNFLDVFGSFGSGDNQFVEPRGIAIYKRYGQVFIAEKKGAQYYWIGSDLKSIDMVKQAEKGRYTLTVSATEYSFINLFSVLHGDTSFYLRHHWIPAGTSNVTVSTMEPGFSSLKIIARIEPTYSSYTYYSWLFTVPVRK